MKKIFIFPIIILLLLISQKSVCQSSIKRGGLCFRVDDNPSLVRLHQFDSIFGRYQTHFCMAMTPWTFPLSPVYVDSLQSLISRGHEVMDNTPTHQTQYFTLLNIQDTLLYYNNLGVDHISSQKVCLKVTNYDTSELHGEGLISINGNRVISQNNGEFGDLAGDPFYFAFYISAPVNKLCLWYDRKAANPFDPDTVYLKSFWEEPVTFLNSTGISYHKLTQRNVVMNPLGVQLLGEESLRLFDEVGLPRPTSWIHPPGQMPWISGFTTKMTMGDSMAYTQGSNFNYCSYLTYNEINTSGYAQFGMQSLDFSTEAQSFRYNKYLLANAVAKHYVKIDVSRFVNPAGGWSSYLSRTDSLLSWCSANNIPVRTYNEWRSLLYDSIPNRITNMFPGLNIDIDDDHYPDGFNQSGMGSVYDTSDGVAYSGNRSFAIYGNGSMCGISELGGLEKGMNKFTIYTKGTNNPGSNITLSFNFPETGQSLTYMIPSDTSVWTGHVQLVPMPTGISVANILILHESGGYDTVKISGMELRSAGFLSTTRLAPQQRTANEPFSPVNLDSLVISTLYPPQLISWTLHGASELNCSILPGNILKILKPVSFWIGQDSLYAVAHAPDGFTDSCFMAFISDSIGLGCAGVPIQLSLIDTLENDIVQWISVPYDSTISNPNIYNPIVSPGQTTTYFIVAINPLGPFSLDTLVLIRYPLPTPSVTIDTTACIGTPILLTATGGQNYLWSNGKTTDTIIVNSPETTRYYVRVYSEYGCYEDTSVLVTRVPKPDINIYGIWPAYCSSDPSSKVIGQPAGGVCSGSTGLIGNTFFPNLAPPGINMIYYTYTSANGCSSTDSVAVNVVLNPVVKQLPDTIICADKSIELHAGPGFDNYLWSNGKTDSTIVFDSTGRSLGLNKVWVYVTKEGCADKDTARINFIVCPIGFGENETSEFFSVYPNPSTTTLVISNFSIEAGEIRYSISNMSGEKVVVGKADLKETKVSISALKAGIYFLRIVTGAKSYNFRVIKL